MERDRDRASPPRKSATDPKAKTRIVLADDHAIVRDGLRKVIDAEPDLEVVGEAGSAGETVQRVADRRPDVLLLDITMPGGGGIGALDQLRKVSPETRILVLTMHEDPEYLRVALVSGAAGFILKHAAGQELLSAIRTVQKGRTYVDPTLAGVALHNALAAGEQLAAGQTAFDKLSPRELEVLRALALGFTNKEVADRLAISVKSVETYRARLSEKLGLTRRAELVRYAIENGLITVDRASQGD